MSEQPPADDAAGAMIRLESVTKQYGEKVAVSDLSLSIPAGVLFAFLGPNGAGKTTTIKMMTGLLRPTIGKVWIAGHSMETQGEQARRQLSYVPDQPHLYDKLTGRDFLHFTRDIYGLSRSETNGMIDELIRRFDMTEYIDSLVETYSHGMRQRTAFAAALLHKPRVLVVDEPMVGLDPQNIRVVKDLFRQCVREGTTVFMSTHTLTIAEEVADRIGIIHRGRLIRHGTLAELRSEINGHANLEEFFLHVTAAAKESA